MDMSTVYWEESRTFRAFRTRRDSVNELLGSKCPDGTEIQMSWRNLLRTKEVPWIKGHALQGQTVFPAAGYIATAIEASKHLVTSRNARVLEIQNFKIHQSMVFNDDDAGIETLFSFSNIVSEIDRTTSAWFAYHSAVDKDSDSMTLMASGQLHLINGISPYMMLPVRALAEPNMIEVEDDSFYASLTEMGYGYTGLFRALSSLQRKLGKATGLISNPIVDGLTNPLMAHPAVLDAAIQSVILAYCYPRDGQLWSLHLPTSIDCIRIDLYLCASVAGEGGLLLFDSALSKNLQSGIYGDVRVYAAHDEHAILQLEGMRAVPFAGATTANDSKIFSSMQWGPADFSGEAAVGLNQASSAEYELAYTLERVAFFYLRSLDQKIHSNHHARKNGPYVGLFNYAKHVCSLVSNSKHPYAKKEWITDTLDFILSTSEAFPESLDLKIMHILGREMPRVFDGATTILEHLLPNNLLDSYYSNALGFPQLTIWLSRMTAQLCHRYPRMKILEIGSGTGGATKRIFEHIDPWFSSYTFTDISNGFFEIAMKTFKGQTDRMFFKVLDLEKDISEQGFHEQSYDLIIASFVLHATTKLEKTMKNVRRLLKPGGHILVAEVTNNDQIRGGFIFGAFPGWWLGADDGRVLSPCVSSTEWDAILRKTGFSGVDTITSDLDRFPYPGSVIASQAVNPQINFLRQPLSAPCPQELGQQLAQKLLIIGGITLKNSSLVEELSEILLSFFPKVDRVGSIAEVTTQHLSPATTVLSLAELDKPIFKDLMPQDFQGLKNAFSKEHTILWVTEGRRADVPESNMTYGFARSQLWEIPDLRLQFIDLESPLTCGAIAIAESLVRFSKLVAWERAGHLQNVLWSLEPELVFKEDQVLIPRLVHSKEANDRLNSSKRRILKQLSAEDSNVSLINQNGSQILEERDLLPASFSVENADFIEIKVEYSLISSIKTLAGQHYVAVGKTTSDNMLVFAISDSQASIIHVPKTQVIPSSCESYDQPLVLLLFAHYLITDYLLSKVYPEETLLFHEPNMLMLNILSRSAVEKRIQVHFTASSSEDRLSVTFIHPYTTELELRKLIPRNTSLFVDWSTDRRATALYKRITSSLPLSCDVEHNRTLFKTESRPITARRAEVISSSFKEAYLKACQDVSTSKCRPDIDLIDIAEFSSRDQIQGSFSLVDWRASSAVSVVVKPVDSKPLFVKNRTYWLVGLTGGLGLSLCEWMVHHGAKYVVLSSRTPKVDGRWTKNMEAVGAVIKVYSSDITDRDAVRNLYREICDSFPPVAGIAQGAMIMKDVPTRDMSFQDMIRVLKPKVDGSRYLDELFPENTLDFFVSFSSMTGIIGNIGQSNYTAANTFMCALARQRRKRGLAASVINIGLITGVEHVTREVSHADQKNLQKGGYIWMSERDFHQIFAEAVFAGRPDSGCDPEIFTGLRRISLNEPYQPIWYGNPVFTKCITYHEVDNTRETNISSGPSITVRLQTAPNETQISNILQDCFCSQLRTFLGGISENDKSEEKMLESRTDELGIDSLIAIEIRSWFLKNLNVNVPVLKILGGILVRDLLQFALKELPKNDKGGEISLSEGPDALLGSVQPGASDQDFTSSRTPSISQTSEPTISSNRSEISAASPILEPISDLAAKSVVTRPPILKELPMSFSQSMFWFITVYLQDKTTLNHFDYFHAHGRLRVNDFERAVNVVAQRHEALRTCFFANDKQRPMQGVLETSVLHLEHKWIIDDSEVQENCSYLKNYIYDIANGEIMRIMLLSKSADEHYLLIGCHHINMDGASHQVLMSDLLKAYNHELLRTDILQYPDYSSHQQEQYRRTGWRTELTYWRKELNDFQSILPILSPSTVTSRRPLNDYKVHTLDVRINPALALRIKDVCRRYRVTSFHFFLAVFKILLFRFSDADDICIGTADANRSESNTLESIGLFVNLLPLRFRLLGSQYFYNAMQEARDKVFNALSNSAVPFEIVLDELKISRSTAHSPLFQAFIDYRQGAREKVSFGECQFEMTEFQAGRTAYDLSIDIIDDPAGESLIMLMTQTSIYSLCDTEILIQSYLHLVDCFAKGPEQQVDRPPLFSAAAIEKALEFGRGPAMESKWPETLPHRIELTIREFGGKVAIKDVNRQNITYGEILKRSNTIASALIDAGITQGSVIAVFQEPASDWICSLLAILKIGAVYLPLDLGTPLTRLAVMAKNSQLSALLVHKATKDQTAALKTENIIVIDVSALISSQLFADIPVLAKPGSPAIILYTSGSTGIPKGTILKHSGIINEIEVSSKMYEIGPADTVLQQSAFSFDMSILQIFLALAVGATLCLVPRSTRGDPVAITELIAQECVSFTCATPSEYINWMSYGDGHSLKRSAWKAALSGGESLSQRLLQLFRSLQKSDLQLYNGYGPTETTCCSTKTKIDYTDLDALEGSLSAGFPSPNEYIYIVDNNLHPIPVGMPGEILIGGAGVAIGYLHDEQMTKKSFIQDLFAPTDCSQEGWKTMYRTGDKGRWRSDGSISIEGRLMGDTQIKLRGIRIELRDVEDAILQASNGALAANVVSTRSDRPGEPEFLVAHVMFNPNYPQSQQESLVKRLPSALPLPQYMCPAVIVPLDQLPINSSGKVDRRSISNLSITKDLQNHSDSIAQTSFVSRVKQIWKEVIPASVFSHYDIGADSDFFHVGGNSILLVKLQALIQRDFGVSFPLAQLFMAPTLRYMALLIKDESKSLNVNSIDWSAETEPALEWDDSVISSHTIKGTATSKVVVLTGATGFLGPYLLKYLSEDPRVEKIHCIAIRNIKNQRSVPNVEKAILHEGDLTLPLLGLPEDTAAAIFEEADVIIHNGADVSHLKTYQTLRLANLNSTKELVKLISGRQVPLHYVSTAGVALFVPRETFGEVSVASTLPPSDGSDGYTASKWASERYLERINERFGLPVWIHRPSSITRSSGFLGEDALEMELLQNLLKYSRLMKAVPVSEKLQGSVDLVSAENVAQSIVGRAVGALSSFPSPSVKYVHQTGDFCLPISDMKTFLEKETNVSFESVSIDKWADEAVELGLHVTVAAAFKYVKDMQKAMIFPKFVKSENA